MKEDRKLNTQGIYNELHRMISDLEIMPGSRVTESQLADYFSVSRTPVRTALQLLENDGLVRIKPKQGCYIRNIDMRKISEFYDVRITMENMALEQIYINQDYDELGELAQQWHPEHCHFGNDINDALKQAEESFHLNLATISKNSVLTNYLADINDKIRVVRMLGWPDIKSVTDTYVEHFRVCELLLNNDLKTAQKEMAQHIRKSQERASCITLEQLYNNTKTIHFD